MYDRRFFRTRLGQAALVSTAAMAAFVALSSQIAVTVPAVPMAVYGEAVLA